MSRPWPPPPDLESLKELFATADVEGLIADGCPMDEYDPEAKYFYEEVKSFAPEKLTQAHTLPILETLWKKQFALDDDAMDHRRPALTSLALQIERFFGPGATPQVRNA